MLKQKLLWTAAVVTVFLITQSRAFGPEMVVAQEQGNEIAVGPSIRNPYNVTVYFQLRHINGGFKNCRLSPGVEKTYKHYDHIWIHSESGTVDYRLRDEGRYVFNWNPYSEKWDLKKR